MKLKTSIKKVSTTTKEEGIDAQIVFEFIVTPQTLAHLMELLELQGQIVYLNVTPEQQDIFRKDEFDAAVSATR